jgi:hypothetical protein
MYVTVDFSYSILCCVLSWPFKVRGHIMVNDLERVTGVETFRYVSYAVRNPN